MSIGDKIKNLREDHDLSQSQLAEILGTSQTVYSRYERNERSLPITTLKKLCDYYKISADYILGLSYTYDRPKR